MYKLSKINLFKDQNMDPLSIVLQALQLGASLISQGATNEVGKDLYVKLKNAISHRSPFSSGLVAAINGYENKPKVYESVLEAELVDSKLFNEQEILAIANEILQRHTPGDYPNNSGAINMGPGTQNNIFGGQTNSTTNNYGGQTNIRTQNNSYGLEAEKITAIGLIKQISSRHKKLENLPPGEASNLWSRLEEIASDSQLTKDFYPESNQAAQLVKIFQLIVAYCCYFFNRYPVPQREFTYSSKNDYYRVMQQLVTDSKFSVELDSIVRDKDMAYLLSSIRQSNF
jgi:hypothetical protein